ncbi:MAG: BMP family ABC transporter substrate-binding protein [Clostridia bacterium]|nr:BMP family ABC transporter substrate-binding protein [Clostridia bacterium]MBO7657924.1 BMP family ABC transporter substrate-binding protein [Clostridia bacterium]MBP5766086.1 BMP family ABC transporter substrate-binding protein [Clostridia bacterium]
MKKIIALIIAIVTVFALAACTQTGKKEVTMDNVKIGVICLHDENSTYDANFINAVKAVQAKLGLKDEQVIIRTGVDESDDCYKAAANMADSGCDIVFADSFGHESYMVQAAKEFPNVEFCHATGVSAKVQNIKNFHNAFASIYEGRYLAGVAAGMKLNEMISSGKITSDQAKIGYVGAWPYAEVISGYTSFFLGARSICPSATMKVVYTNSWFDIAKEKESAENLIKDGCVLISQHADSEGAPKACEAAGVPNIAYNVDTTNLGPNTAIISSKIDWEPYFELIINAVVKGESIPTDYCGDFSTGSVALTKLNEKAAAPGTAEKIAEVEAKLKSGELKVFSTDAFTYKGEKLTEYKADVDGDYAPDTNVIHDGYFDESNAKDFRSAPYFDMIIDGITVPET